MGRGTADRGGSSAGAHRATQHVHRRRADGLRASLWSDPPVHPLAGARPGAHAPRGRGLARGPDGHGRRGPVDRPCGGLSCRNASRCVTSQQGIGRSRSTNCCTPRSRIFATGLLDGVAARSRLRSSSTRPRSSCSNVPSARAATPSSPGCWKRAIVLSIAALPEGLSDSPRGAGVGWAAAAVGLALDTRQGHRVRMRPRLALSPSRERARTCLTRARPNALIPGRRLPAR